jgi:hypothetical protein
MHSRKNVSIKRNPHNIEGLAIQAAFDIDAVE